MLFKYCRKDILIKYCGTRILCTVEYGSNNLHTRFFKIFKFLRFKKEILFLHIISSVLQICTPKHFYGTKYQYFQLCILLKYPHASFLCSAYNSSNRHKAPNTQQPDSRPQFQRLLLLSLDCQIW